MILLRPGQLLGGAAHRAGTRLLEERHDPERRAVLALKRDRERLTRVSPRGHRANAYELTQHRDMREMLAAILTAQNLRIGMVERDGDEKIARTIARSHHHAYRTIDGGRCTADDSQRLDRDRDLGEAAAPSNCSLIRSRWLRLIPTVPSTMNCGVKGSLILSLCSYATCRSVNALDA